MVRPLRQNGDRITIPSYYQIYRNIKKSIRFHRQYTLGLCFLFFFLQYSIPIFTGVLTGFLGLGNLPKEVTVVLGIFATILSSLNSVIKPAESYAWAAFYGNKFDEFEKNFDLGIAELELQLDKNEQLYIEFLRTKNAELSSLIELSNKQQIELFKNSQIASVPPPKDENNK